MITMYGIPNCDTIKKAKKWLEQNNIDYLFHNYKKQGIESSKLQTWCNSLGYEKLLNQRGTTWRKLDESDKSDLDQAKAIDIMQNHTSIIKRPILECEGKIILGFDQEQYKTLL